jgi:Tfp pilus assembly protein PilF
LYETILKSLPDDAATLNSLAMAYHQSGDLRALDYAQQALKLAPDTGSVLDTYRWLLVNKGESARALKYLRQARLYVPSVPDVRFHLAVALHALGRDQEATNELRAVLLREQSFDGMDEAKALLKKLSTDS